MTSQQPAQPAAGTEATPARYQMPSLSRPLSAVRLVPPPPEECVRVAPVITPATLHRIAVDQSYKYPDQHGATAAQAGAQSDTPGLIRPGSKLFRASARCFG